MLTEQEISALASRIKLATVSCGAWRATRTHKQETEAQRTAHGTDAVSVRVRLTDSDELRAIVSHQEQAMRDHRRLTLPTPSGDIRMLTAGRELEHIETMRAAAIKHDALVQAFMATYPDLMAQAPQELGSLYDPTMWPAPAAVADKFRLSWRYLACPVGGAWSDWLSESAEIARAALRDDMRDTAARAAERLRNAKRLHASVIDDALDAARAVQASEGLADAETALAAASILSGFTSAACDLVKDAAARDAAAARAEGVAGLFSGVSL